MTTLSRTLRTTAVLVAAAFALVLAIVPASKAHAAAPFRVWVFSKTTGFRHDSIPAGIAAIRQLGQQNGFTVDASEDDTKFTDANLAQYAAVIFLSTTGDPVTTQAGKDALQRYIQRGGGFVGIHAAADSGYNWPWYGRLVGAYFKQHPAQQNARVKVEDPNHPSTQGLPAQITRFDEWYDFRTNPRATVHVLTTLDETSYSGGTMGADHPNTWCQNIDGGRSWYTGMGHTIESFSEANFLHLLLGGIQTAAGAVPANCAVTTPPPPTTRQIVGTQSGRCVSVANSNGSQAQLADCVAGQASQTWTPTATKQLTVYGTKCLDASGRGTSNGTQVIIWDCNGQPNQQWNVNSNGTITGVQSGLCVDASGQGTANGTKLVLWSCSGQANQQWTLR
ncbi:ThuA domain-containing protein [Actinocrispum sp. NPDC049592]|uniref:ThuA domain-containing protein n=1 Tax=Actinocrispum sp. NPDC049592 TaxID=3154835 RepID=UPI00342C0384